METFLCEEEEEEWAPNVGSSLLRLGPVLAVVQFNITIRCLSPGKASRIVLEKIIKIEIEIVDFSSRCAY